ncbi:hypothetical protein [Isachenkonia alkalipeptolytica]|uniref:Uncharacterized protein n=1 Tax=Isachenkonia alkalipeptolytica TaxID=2565777 RepID=A0AA43XK69_9CLOT|nr:hypothetical protein [Isachenkonia alkalipeptolytica]NBG88405.1 hypothetical protein [Isachenkonia alkalipeptolytica]
MTERNVKQLTENFPQRKEIIHKNIKLSVISLTEGGIHSIIKTIEIGEKPENSTHVPGDSGGPDETP